MKNRNVVPPEHVEMLRTMPFGDLVVDIIEIAGFPPLTEAQHRGFMYLHSYLFEPQPDWLTELRRTEKGQHWYLIFVGGIYDAVQSARKAASYHVENLQAIEQAVAEIFAGRDTSAMRPGAIIAVGSTHKLEYEYHAYILAYRRTLEYLARAIAGYFKSQCNSFRELPKILARQQTPASKRVSAVYEKYSPSFSFVVSQGGSHTSLRDVLCHYEFLSAGVYNLTSTGLRFFGGAEGLGRGTTPHLLSKVLLSKIDLLDEFLVEMLCELTDGIREDHARLPLTSQ